MSKETAMGNWRYSLEINGLNRFLIQKITSPEVEINEIIQGAPGNGPNVKIPGKYKAGDLVVNKIKPAEQGDQWAWTWLASAVAFRKEFYNKTGLLSELDVDGITPVQTYFLGECWCKKIGTSGYESDTDGDKLMETATISVRYFYPTSSPDFKQIFAI